MMHDVCLCNITTGVPVPIIIFVCKLSLQVKPNKTWITRAVLIQHGTCYSGIIRSYLQAQYTDKEKSKNKYYW